MPKKTGRDPAQFGLFATPLEAMIAPDAEVRVIAAFVDQLDLDELGFKSIQSMGASAYGADVLLKIYLYGYLNRVRSSRRLARECALNIELMWLTGNLQPKQKTIAAFRQYHPAQLKKVFREYVLLLKEWDLIGGKRLAVDGTKIHGQNARKKNFNADKLKRHLGRIDQRIEEAMEEFDQLDRYEESEEKQELRAGAQNAIKVFKARKANYESLQKQLDASEDTQISLTDPEARSLIKHGRESLVGYNVQSVVDADHKLIVHTEATNENDLNALGQLVEDTSLYIGLDKGAEILADKGYHNAAELQRVRDLGHTTFVAERRHASRKSETNYPPTHFCYDEGQDAYICPAGQLLKSTGKFYQRKGTSHRFQTYRASRTDCRNCPLRKECLSATSLARNAARSISRLEHAAAVEANHDNLFAHPGVYQQRQAIVEHPFGTLKRYWTGYYTLLRCKRKVDGEFSLLACCYNLRRSVSILGVPELLARLKARFSAFWVVFTLRSVVRGEVFGVFGSGHSGCCGWMGKRLFFDGGGGTYYSDSRWAK
ncbi:MAG: IS1182 family transposase [Bacteroidota bacterium]